MATNPLVSDELREEFAEFQRWQAEKCKFSARRHLQGFG